MSRRNRKTDNQDKTQPENDVIELNSDKQSENIALDAKEQEVIRDLEAQEMAIHENAEALLNEEKMNTQSGENEVENKNASADRNSLEESSVKEKADNQVLIKKDKEDIHIMNEKSNSNNSQLSVQTPPQYSSIKRSVTFLYLALALAIGAAGYGAYYMEQHKYDHLAEFEKKISANAANVDKTFQKIQSIYEEVKAKDDRIAALLHENDELKGINNVLKNSVDELQKLVGTSIENEEKINVRLHQYESRNPNDWLVAKSYFLVSNAQNLLETSDNIKAALFNLENAQVILARIDDPEIIKVRDAIFSDIQTLKSVSPVDVRGISFKLDSVLNNTDAMPLNEFLESNIKVFKKKDEVTDDIKDWKQNLLTSLKSFSSRFIEIRRRDEAIVNQFLSPEQTGILLKNLKTQLLLAKVALYQQDEQAFMHNIDEVISSLNNYYDLKNSTVAANLETLKELKEGTIVLKKPESLKSYPLISKVATDKFNLYSAQRAKEAQEAAADVKEEKTKNASAGDKKKSR